MKHLFSLILTMALCVGALSLTGCGDDNPYHAIPETDETFQTIPTVPVPADQLSLSRLMRVMGPDMRWSDILQYTHTIEDGKAVFAVADGYGKSCTMTVTFDEASDTISVATLSYGTTAVSALSDDTMVIREIRIAMDRETTP